MTRRQYLFMFAVCGLSFRASANEAADYLDRYEAYLAGLPAWHVSATSDSVVTGEVSRKNYARRSKYEFAYFRDGTNFDIERKMERIDDEGNVVLTGHNRRTIKLDDHHFARQSYGGGYERSFTLTRVKQLPDKSVPPIAMRTYPDQKGGEALDGFFAADGIPATHLLRLADDLSVRSGSDVVGEHPCFVLEGNVPGRGHYVLWLSPAHNWAPLRAIVTKAGDDFYGDKRLSEEYPGLPPGVVSSGKNFPSDVLSKLEYEMDNVTFEEFDGQLIPMGCRTRITQSYPEGTSTTFTRLHERQKISLAPDFQALGALEWAIEDGTTIRDMEHQPLKYKMEDGELMPLVEQATAGSTLRGN